MEVAPFFVDFHHFYRFSQFTHFCRDLHFVAIYALFPQIFMAKIAITATSHVFCMYAPMYIQTVPLLCAFNLHLDKHLQLGAQRCIYAPLPGPICQGFVVDEIIERVGRSDKSKF